MSMRDARPDTLTRKFCTKVNGRDRLCESMGRRRATDGPDGRSEVAVQPSVQPSRATRAGGGRHRPTSGAGQRPPHALADKARDLCKEAGATNLAFEGMMWR